MDKRKESVCWLWDLLCIRMYDDASRSSDRSEFGLRAPRTFVNSQSSVKGFKG